MTSTFAARSTRKAAVSRPGLNDGGSITTAAQGGAIWHDVEMVEWPADESRRIVLRQARTPRLLLVPHGCVPPLTEDHYEDWIRTPADPRDVQARASAVRLRAARNVLPRLDDEGCLHVQDRWVALSPIEHDIVDALLADFGQVVYRTTLEKRLWPTGKPGRNQLDVRIKRLRRHLAPVHLTVRTIYSKGYSLEWASQVRDR